MMPKKRCGMPKRSTTETAHLELIQNPSLIPMKEAALGDNGERSGDHMVIHPLEVQKAINGTGIHENFVWTCMIRFINKSENGLVRCLDAF
jgi:hypothetical protein